jgi:class 3 adenylate cyclase
VIVEPDDLYGDGVNIAARIANCNAKPAATLASSRLLQGKAGWPQSTARVRVFR